MLVWLGACAGVYSICHMICRSPLVGWYQELVQVHKCIYEALDKQQQQCREEGLISCLCEEGGPSYETGTLWSGLRLSQNTATFNKQITLGLNLLCSLALQVHFIVASCENMVAGHGLRPGDVLTSASGAFC